MNAETPQHDVRALAEAVRGLQPAVEQAFALLSERTPAPSTPDTDLRDRIAAVLAEQLPGYDVSNAFIVQLLMQVVQPELDRLAAEISRLDDAFSREICTSEQHVNNWMDDLNRLSTALREMARRVTEQRRLRRGRITLGESKLMNEYLGKVLAERGDGAL
ncbi:hypothetical protein M8C13_04375 [Crossiella sp. SN42]|uniref:hypothetical protein n=1 Tax=Crossiella sp. SN42 TaxID=2944808 RepID=UPI00207C7EEF|nr:hypothetical protein [Crossiella sp. SN42]MCO1574994.1 hypothetical protein [Crossiella sp. SN42]